MLFVICDLEFFKVNRFLFDQTGCLRSEAGLNPRMKLRQNGIVSFSIKLAAFQASGGADR
jgi:hypothetical protein